MEFRSNNEMRKGLTLIRGILIAVLAVLILVVIILPKGKDTEQNQTQGNQTTASQTGSTQSGPTLGAMAELVIESVEEAGEEIRVTTSYGSFSYPFAYSELLVVEAFSDANRAALVFKANLGDSTEPVFTLWINHDTGIYAGKLTVAGDSYPMYIELPEPRAELDEALLPAFHAAQETLNDVLQSMVEAGILSYED